MITPYLSEVPKIHPTCFIAPSADVIGDVHLEEDVNIWYGAVLRGDVNSIRIGKGTNIQDQVVVHVADGFSCTLGENVTVGHGAIVHACEIGNNVLVGMGAIVLDGAIIEDNVIIGAGALIPPGKRIASGSMVIGSPGKVVRELTEKEVEALRSSAKKYVALSKNYLRNEQVTK